MKPVLGATRDPERPCRVGSANFREAKVPGHMQRSGCMRERTGAAVRLPGHGERAGILGVGLREGPAAVTPTMPAG